MPGLHIPIHNPYACSCPVKTLSIVPIIVIVNNISSVVILNADHQIVKFAANILPTSQVHGAYEKVTAAALLFNSELRLLLMQPQKLYFFAKYDACLHNACRH